MNKIRMAMLAGAVGLLSGACSSSLVSKATDNTGVATTTATTTVTTAASTTTPTTTASSTAVSSASSTATSSATADTTTTAPGSGSGPTTAPASQKTTAKTSPKTTTTPAPPSGPVFTAFSVIADACPTTTVAPDASFVPPPYNGKVTLSWKVTGPYDMIYDAIDNANGPFNSGLPSSGTETFGRQCGGSHTYYVVAVSNGKKTIKSKVVAAG